MKNCFRKLISITMICLMAFVWLEMAAFAAPVSAASKSKPKFSKKTVTITKGSKKTIKLKNVHKRVKWKSSNKKVVKVVKIKGKHRNIVTIKGVKKGKAFMIAKVGKKTYKCKVIVKAGGRKIKIRPLSASSKDLSASLKRKAKGNTKTSGTFSSAYTKFSIELFKKVSAEETAKGSNASVLISPDSVETALAMMENGASGDTLTEMQNAMGGGMTRADFCSYLAGMNQRLEKNGNIIFRQANSIWARKGVMEVKKSFLQTNKNYFKAKFYLAPFNSTTVKDMNNWVYNNTRNMISEVIDHLEPDVMTVLINTTVFEGKWQAPFEHVTSGTKQDKFTNAAGGTKSVTMLHETAFYEYFEMNGAKCFRRDYKGGKVAFVGILPPPETSIDAFVQNMSGSGFRKAWKSRDPKYVALTMPEFTYDYGTNLGTVLQAMGIQTAFTDQADFSRMGTPPVKIDQVIHKTHIELDKNGTKAAAVTAVVSKASSFITDPPIEITLNRPFVYALVDTQTGVPLFIGTVKTM